MRDGNQGRPADDHCTVTSRCPAARRTTAAVLMGAVLFAAGTGTAAAHVHVDAPGAVAGTGPVTLEFSAASEAGAGITAMRTRLPAGIAPAGVSLASGPSGWTLTPTAQGFEVGGPALPSGEDAEYAVTVAGLPAGVTELAFPTVQVYADGTEDAWIEQEVPGGPEPELPAPVLTVAPGVPAPQTPAPASPTVVAEPTAPTASAPAVAAAADEGTGSGRLLAVAAVAGLAAVAGGLWYRRSGAGR
ncbi:Domain of unkown function [Geodermatophilus poikilotrophus]|uniref:Domain of unkown function n=1 Tax=Geodermatophilus poikilotrophus TaxID=1333667 RepID=A0A1I0AZA1_9ACTN|nr:Domain of unkown function [Geodermatophilus poikilotrophus]